MKKITLTILLLVISLQFYAQKQKIIGENEINISEEPLDTLLQSVPWSNDIVFMELENSLVSNGDSQATSFATLEDTSLNDVSIKDKVSTQNDCISFHFETVEEDITSSFCLGQEVYIDAQVASIHTKYYLELSIINSTGDEIYTSPGWVQGNLNSNRINLNDVFPELVFSIGTTYQIKLAVDTPFCGGWQEEIQTFEFSDVSDFASLYLLNSEGKNTDLFCLGEDVIIDIIESKLGANSYSLTLYELTNGNYTPLDLIDGPYSDINQPIDEGFLNITEIFEERGISFQAKTYAIGFSLIYPDCGESEIIKDFTYVTSSGPFSIHFQDDWWNDTNEFCLDEDVFIALAGGTMPYANNYLIYLSRIRYESGTEYVDFIGGSGVNGDDISQPVNLTKRFAEGFNHTFESGEYRVTFLVYNTCGNEQFTKDFTYVDPGNSITYNYEDKEGNITDEFCFGDDVYLDAKQTYYTGSYFISLHTLKDDGSYRWIASMDWQYLDLTQPINITEKFEDLGVTFLEDRTYSIKFSLIDPVCGQVIVQKDFTYNNCFNLLALPKVQSNGNTLSWDPVPGADHYIVETNKLESWPLDCSCLEPISLIPITTETGQTSITLPLGFNQCSSVQVTAVSANGYLGTPSDAICVSVDQVMKSAVTISPISIFPNPNNGKMNIQVETSTDIKNITLKIRNINGVLIKRVENFKVNKGVLNSDLDLSSQLKQGVYFFVFTIGNETITKQVIIK